VMIAAAWFTIHAWIVSRAVNSIQVESELGGLVIRETIPKRILVGGAILTGVMLALVAGGGGWWEKIAIARERVHFGQLDPTLGIDLGILVTSYPLWLSLQRYAVLLTIVALLFVAMLYLGLGALRKHGPAFDVHLHARRHLSGLIGLLALTIAVGYILAPYRLATAPQTLVPGPPVETRILVTQAVAGIAVAVALLSFVWGLGRRHSLVLSAWLVLILAAFAERVVLPALLDKESQLAFDNVTVKALEERFWALRFHADESADTTSFPATPGLWDQASLVSSNSGGLFAFPVMQAGSPIWTVVSSSGGESDLLELRSFRGGVASPTGLPDPIGNTNSPIRIEGRIVPGSRGVRSFTDGVASGGILRRATLAWALQSPQILTNGESVAFDWNLDPAERLGVLIPPLSWVTTGIVTMDGRSFWSVAGLTLVDRAPGTTRVDWLANQISGAMPALIGLVDVALGSVRIFVDPGADSLGTAWGRVFGGIVEPSTDIPTQTLEQLSYPVPLLEAQLAVLEGPVWDLGQRPGGINTGDLPARPAAVWGSGDPALQVTFERGGLGNPKTLVSATMDRGTHSIRVQHLADPASLSARDLVDRVQGDPEFQRLSDSLTAAGDSLVRSPVRRFVGGAGEFAWQVWRSAGRTGAPRILWIASSVGPEMRSSRHVGSFWPTALDSVSLQEVENVRASARIEALRGWMLRADSALTRGDLTAFARAWEALRGLLEETELQ
jgi:hypothetical protein